MSPSMNNPETLARARIRITDIGAAASVEAWREDIGIARGWIDALQCEGLIDEATFRALDAEIDAAVAKWDGDAPE